jgi:hypothetical protein
MLTFFRLLVATCFRVERAAGAGALSLVWAATVRARFLAATVGGATRGFRIGVALGASASALVGVVAMGTFFGLIKPASRVLGPHAQA